MTISTKFNPQDHVIFKSFDDNQTYAGTITVIKIEAVAKHLPVEIIYTIKTGEGINHWVPETNLTIRKA